jgi:hypothetical protein
MLLKQMQDTSRSVSDVAVFTVCHDDRNRIRKGFRVSATRLAPRVEIKADLINVRRSIVDSLKNTQRTSLCVEPKLVLHQVVALQFAHSAFGIQGKTIREE